MPLLNISCNLLLLGLFVPLEHVRSLPFYPETGFHPVILAELRASTVVALVHQGADHAKRRQRLGVLVITL
jgi:hypothetical protein